jgi:polar amino acid transport system substrate-binding protein
MIKKVLICFLLFLTCIQIFSNELNTKQTVSLVSLNWSPYAAKNLKDQGFTTEILRKIFKNAGYNVKFTFVPWNRALVFCKLGKYDAVFNAYTSKEREEIYAVSDPYLDTELVLCVKKDFPLNSFNNLQELKKYKIGIVKGYVNSPEFDACNFLHKEPARNDEINLRKLLADKVQIISIDKYTATNLLKEKHKLDTVKFLKPPLDNKPLYLLFSKKIIGNDKILSDFNSALKAL